MVNFKSVRMGYPFVVAKHHHRSKRAAPACSNPAFYTAPTSGQTVSASDPLTISWDTSSTYATCLGNTQQVDIYLVSPAVPDGRVKAFSPVTFSTGTYTRTLDPKWWNSTSNIQLQLSIVPTGTPLFLSPISAGPVLNVTYDSSKAGAVTNDTSPDPTLATSNAVAQTGGLPKGRIAAAVLLPILVVCLAIFVYIKISRKKEAEKRKRWSHALDARMSRISGDWQSMSAKGAQAAIRNSTATGMRMSTVFAQEMQMGVGGDRISIAAMSRASTESMYSRASRFNPGERTSRISFAADVNASKERLSTYSTGRASRAFHVGTVPPVPPVPVPANTWGNSPASETENTLSPTQTQGPVVLSNDDIHHMDIAPALSLMRTGTNPALKSSDDLLFNPPTPLTPTMPPPSPLGASASAPPLSPLGVMPMQPQQAMYMSPDDLLRRYAEMRATGAKSPTLSLPTTVSLPSPIYTPTPSTPTLGVPQYTASGMRNLTGDSSLNDSESHVYMDSQGPGHASAI